MLEPAFPGLEHLLRVTAPDRQRGWYPKPPLNVPAANCFPFVRSDQGGGHIQDHEPTQVRVCDLRGRGPWEVEPKRDGALGRATSIRCNAAGVSSSNARGTVGPEASCQHLPLVAQHLDVTDRLTGIGQHHRNVDQHLAPVVHQGERAPCIGPRALLGQAGPVDRILTAMLLAWTTTTLPSADTGNPLDQIACFVAKCLPRWEI